MKQFLQVLKFELNNYFKNKSFLLTTALLTLLAVGLIAVPAMFMGGKNTEEKEETDVREFAIFDEKDSISNLEELSAAMGGTLSWKECESADQVRELVKKDQVEGGFLVEDLLHYTYVVENNSMTDSTDGAFAQALASIYRTQYLEEKGIDAEEISQLYQVTPESQMEILGKNSVKNYVGYGFILLADFLWTDDLCIHNHRKEQSGD